MFNITLPKIVGLSTLIAAAVLIPTAILLGLFQNNPNKITIHPEFNINTDLINCLNSADALIPKIDKPTEGQTFLTTDNIAFAGSNIFKCQSLIDQSKVKYKLNYKYEWFLNSASTTFSTAQSGSLGKKPAGSYNLKFKVTLEVVGLQTIDKQVEVNFKVNAPVLSVVTQKPVTKPPTKPPVNKSPSAKITNPKSEASYTATYDAKSGRYYAIIRFTGTGTDPEDGNLTGGSLSWYYKTPTGTKTFFGNGPNPSLTVYVNACSTTIYTITLTAKDSKGATGSASISVTVNENSCLL